MTIICLPTCALHHICNVNFEKIIYFCLAVGCCLIQTIFIYNVQRIESMKHHHHYRDLSDGNRYYRNILPLPLRYIGSPFFSCLTDFTSSNQRDFNLKFSYNGLHQCRYKTRQNPRIYKTNSFISFLISLTFLFFFNFFFGGGGAKTQW